MKAGVLLSGSGVMDGSEIHESVLTLLHLDKKGLETICMAPNNNQTRVVNHLRIPLFEPLKKSSRSSSSGEGFTSSLTCSMALLCLLFSRHIIL